MFAVYGPNGCWGEVLDRATLIELLRRENPALKITVEGGPVRNQDGSIYDPRQKVITDQGRYILCPEGTPLAWVRKAVQEATGIAIWDAEDLQARGFGSAMAEALADIEESERRQDAGLEETPL